MCFMQFTNSDLPETRAYMDLIYIRDCFLLFKTILFARYH